MRDRFSPVQQLILLGLFFSVTFVLYPARIFGDDHQVFLSWINGIVSQGLANAYEIEKFNYGPGAAYFFFVFGEFFGSRLPEYNVLLRQALFLFDLGAIFILMRYLERNGRNAVRAFFILFNLAFLYNALVWGQMDGMTTALVFAAIVAGLVGQPEMASVMFVVAFSVKPQPIVLLPVVGLLLIPALAQRPARIVTTLVAAVGAQLVVLIPFLANGAWRDWIDAYFANTGLFPLASVKGYNFWYLVLAGDPVKIRDWTTFWGITYRTWGLFMFGVLSVVALLPLVVRMGVRALKRQSLTDRDGMLTFLVAGMVSVGFFFFCTQIHERYAYPAILFLGAYAVMAQNYVLYILVSVAHLLNINAIFPLSGLPVPLIHRLSSPEVVALLFLIALVLGLVQLYGTRSFSEDVSMILDASRNWRTRGAAPRRERGRGAAGI